MSDNKAEPATRNEVLVQQVTKQQLQQDCLACRVIGSGALGVTGLYALNQSRAHAPGSVFGKRIMAGLGVCLLVAGGLRWNSTAPKRQIQYS